MHDPKRSEDPNLSRRGALIRMMEVSVAIAGTALLTSGATENHAEARRPPPPIEPQSPLVSLQLQSPHGGEFPSFRHGGDVWIAGSEGERYSLRLQNHSPERVEVVVSVDGRDVISGRLGDYAKQRGYVIDPFGVLVIEGYRQSLDNVAAFRFADLADSYSARLGTPVHVGIIGVAAFAEKVRSRRHKQPLAPIDGDPFPGEDAGVALPPSSVVSGADKARRSAEKRGEAGSSGGWAAPEQPNSLGTEYGESTFAPVEEVSFKRKHNKKPDQLLVLRYDSIDGLRSRGVVFDDRPVHRPVRTWDREPRRPSGRDFAPPPPPRDWWR
ncbi:hypothetical protein [Enhygromyxa salina]|uniref:Outer membrane lipoprotein n=1 Tax=Enhygromyxa salina TaxID=215803 RepID=A0A2S9YXQ7_9BACT|nr:hypothetical protein [Enhygromyxa salina]PRQ09849.1 hypothetical protein ENSA7_03990 [Enhygromyxa salina]